MYQEAEWAFSIATKSKKGKKAIRLGSLLTVESCCYVSTCEHSLNSKPTHQVPEFFLHLPSQVRQVERVVASGRARARKLAAVRTLRARRSKISRRDWPV